MPERKLKVILTRSIIGLSPKQEATVKALGLRRMHQTVEKPNNPQMRGMIRQIAHMLRVEAIEEQAAPKKPRRAAKVATTEEPRPARRAAKINPMEALRVE